MQKITLLMIFYRNYFEVFFLLLQIAFISQTLIVQFIIQKTGFGGGLIWGRWAEEKRRNNELLVEDTITRVSFLSTNQF